ncbi:MAG: hypothetical protein FJX76_13905 [Armatimonadetes bacterium]|nr:hypothetical protein [Armatimonadota bacterium]
MAEEKNRRVLDTVSKWMRHDGEEDPPEVDGEKIPPLDWDIFKKALDYAYDHEAEYEKVADERQFTAVRVATADFLYAPQIDDLDVSAYHGQIGDVIKVRAHDDVLVKDVRVLIVDKNHQLIEKGFAAQVGDHWEYVATVQSPVQPVRIAVSATDLPGHTGLSHADKSF